MKKYNFENLEIWRLAVKGIQEIDMLINRFPKAETYVLTDQLKRASLSVALYIAEGSGRGSKLDFKRFIRISIGSALEVIAGIRIAIAKGYLDENSAATADLLYQELYFKLVAMEKYLKK